MLCPVDCVTCGDALCRADGCKLSGEPMLEACHFCGEILTGSSRALICVSSIDDSPAEEPHAPAPRR